MSEEKKGENLAEEMKTETDVETVQEPVVETDANNTGAQGEEPKKQKTMAKKILGGIAEFLVYVLIAVVCLMVVPKYVVQRTEVSGDSMERTLQNEDNILVEKLSYRFGDPERFDIIVFYHFYDDDYQDKKDEECYDYYVKRIIGLPGETVQIVEDTIYINGEPLEENYGKDPIDYQGVAAEPFTLGEDEYFVLGDNREVSQDSRYEEVGNISRDQIVGKAWLRVYPFNKFGFPKH